MRWLINYLRACFCNHYFELVEKTSVYYDDASKRPHKIVYFYMCSRCGTEKKITIE